MLGLTQPQNWTPHAVHQATRLFVSNLNARMAQRFLALVVLPHVRNDIEDNKRLHFALFQSLKEGHLQARRFLQGGLGQHCEYRQTLS